ncbi:V-type ATPase 116kDa subunit family protein [Lentzea sp. HUAS12]|uniref:V-type ATPase 116kDa subunit family protein n=1 Tax=Lentzea sp. HUAS12 TaxID=2951806 RepID=UPI00209DD71A|nr:V-type ATPase 116kDa subunit family protein [Lentzea sp. HUAS12]USX53933.1 ATPase [Lentzea sp. HUAS12]
MTPVRMERIAIVAPEVTLRDALLVVANAGVVDVDRADDAMDTVVGGAVRRESAAAVAGWCPAEEKPGLAAELAEVGAGAVPLPVPRGVDPPSLLRSAGAVRRSFTPLVSTYGTVPYQDVDPTVLAGAAYVLMFGMMFGDAGQGLLLVVVAVLLRAGWPARLARWRSAWPFVLGAGAASTLFGVLYGEFFGPTGVVPVLWLDPLDDPVRLLGAGVAAGAVLLAAAYTVAIVNRWREGGTRLAVYASSGVAGAALFLGIAGIAGGLLLSADPLAVTGAVVAVMGLVLAGIGFAAASGGGAAGWVQAAVELFDIVIRTGSNLVSFARLAAFGLVHAAIGSVVWLGTTALAGRGGGTGIVAAVLLFLLGNVLAFSLEALVAAIQALRLEYYELFSRVFEIEGRPFRPWHGEAR